jgi:hypothetical protein
LFDAWIVADGVRAVDLADDGLEARRGPALCLLSVSARV